MSEARRGAIREYVAHVVDCPADRVHAVTRFADGNRHDVYKASYLDRTGVEDHVVVRVSLANDDREREQVKREAAVLETLCGAGAPRLLDVSLAGPWFATPVLGMQFVPGRSVELSSATATHIERLALVVASVHNSPTQAIAGSIEDSGTVLSYARDRLRHILNGLQWTRDPLPPLLRERVRRAAESVEREWERRRDTVAFRTDDALALLHGDIAFGNVLWEPLTLLGSTLWWIERWVRRSEAEVTRIPDPAAPKDPGYYLAHATTRLDRLEDLLSPM